MSTEGKITEHWTHGSLAEAIMAALEKAGVDTARPSVRDLEPMDHLHGGGAEATRGLLARLSPRSGRHILDIGSGIGGPARLLASEYGCRVTGIDLTREFCDVAVMLTERTGLDDRVSFRQASALDLPFDDACFDGAYSQNVSMNISDKAAFYGEACRVLKPGGLFVAAEIAEGPEGPPFFPVPWALTPENSHLSKLDEISDLLAAAGFRDIEIIDQTAAMMDFHQRARARIAAEGEPVLSPKVVIGEDADERLGNSVRGVGEKRVIPLEVVCRKPNTKDQ
jgi:SAM-dependent methyltransferase|tara:strand:+ start:3229 stop:4071 length:843 start_codon:yes stop_codon:yes gene_type:complete